MKNRKAAALTDHLKRTMLHVGAVYSGPLFTSVPSPLYMAEKLKLDEIQHIFEQDKAL